MNIQNLISKKLQNINGIPVGFIRYQGTMLKTLGGIALSSVNSRSRPKTNPTTFQPAESTISAPPRDLVDAYIAWSGGDAADYANTLPPHMVSQWTLPIASAILRQSAYKLSGIINQGVDLSIFGALPRDVPLHLKAYLAGQNQTGNRVRLSIAIETGTAEQACLVKTILHVAFILPRQKGEKSEPKTKKQTNNTATWQTVGTWQTDSQDGLRFALLTGDFNPIHWIGLAGKLSPFKRKVLHGFGMLARSYETLMTEKNIDIKQLEVKFLSPVPLPSLPLSVQYTEQKQWRLLGNNDRVHLAGTFS